MDPISSMHGIDPTRSYIGPDGNLSKDSLKLDPNNTTNPWSIWDGNNWKPIMPQDMVAQAAAELREVLKNTDGKTVQSHNMDEVRLPQKTGPFKSRKNPA